ncbi:phospholipase [bacterium]|nr:phospholipase [bacterium]
MRQLVKNEADDFRVKGYAGTTSMLLAMDLAESRKAGFLGFAIEGKEGSKDWEWLSSSLHFEGQKLRDGKLPSCEAPFQKFRWGDYSCKPGEEQRYRIHLVYGKECKLGESLEIALKPDDGNPSGHHVNFNRAAAASQAFSRHFPDLEKQISKKKDMSIDDWPIEPREWLENGLLDSILGFIDKAVDQHWALDVAIYEYELTAIVDAISNAFQRKVELRVLYHYKNNDEQSHDNEMHLVNIPAANKKPRKTSSIFHDKFIVLSRLDANGNRMPQAVLCGSTNFTENGVYRQANVVHVIENQSVAEKYETLFDQLWANNDKVADARKWITDNNPIDETQELFVGFSPRRKETDLDTFVKIINSADRDILFATAFRLPARILEALKGKPHDSVLRFGLQNTASEITGIHADCTASFTATALYSRGLEGWVKEGLHNKPRGGNILVHTKAVVANFTSNHPTIISGSHNLSVPASYSNDENYLIIRNNTDLADRYGLEIIRFYDHYRFRYFVKKYKLTGDYFLKPDESWTNQYYKAGTLKHLDRLRFSGR